MRANMWIGFFLLLLLSACGGSSGGGSGNDPVSEPIPNQNNTSSLSSQLSSATQSSAAKSSSTSLAPPSFSVQSGSDEKKITLSWPATSDNLSYKIYRKSAESGSFELISTVESGETDAIFYIDTAVDIDIVYFYQIKACLKSALETCSQLSDAKSSVVSVYYYEDILIDADIKPIRDGGAGCAQGLSCAIGIVGNLWPVNSVLGVGFDFSGITRAELSDLLSARYHGICYGLGTDAECFSLVKKFILDSAGEWSRYGAVSFVEKDWADAEITIAFKSGKGSNSRVGKNSLNAKPSMNYNWLDKGTVIHEFGHALGFVHEQSSPHNYLIFNEKLILSDYKILEPSWSEEKVYANVINRLSETTAGLFVSKEYDPKSIMQYWLRKSWVLNSDYCPEKNNPTYCIVTAQELSIIDQRSMAALYPFQNQMDVSWSPTHELLAGNGGRWGAWHPSVYCPQDQFVAGLRLRVEAHKSNFDDSSLNSVEFYCRPLLSPMNYFSRLSSHQGFWGNWGAPKYCDSGVANGFQLKVEAGQSDNDDTAANDINLVCRNGQQINGDGGPYGAWSEKKYCPENEAICGAQLKIEAKQGDGDDTALNDIKIYCCPIN